jgi:hypothetical protein
MNGMDGMDASETLYGDGSSGARTIAADARFETEDDANQQWTDFTVEEGVTLRVQSGAVIRCSGSFVNRGTILVESGAQGGDRSGFDSSTAQGAERPAALGINTLGAAGGEVGDTSAERAGGAGGDGISEFEARVTLRLGLRAGSGGAAALTSGGAGGGGLTVLALGTIENLGTIMADGADSTESGGGGGGGGVILLASAEAIMNDSSAGLMARGGAGGAAGSAVGPGGGGGGGLIHLIAPVILDQGVMDVTGGDAGAIAAGAMVTADMRAGGGGGGGSAGAGGDGGGVPDGAMTPPGAATAGSAGRALHTLRNPALILR